MCKVVTCETLNLVTPFPKNSDRNSKQLRELARTKGRSRLIQFSYQRPNGRSFLNLRFQSVIGISRKKGRTISYRLTGRNFFLSLISTSLFSKHLQHQKKKKKGKYNTAKRVANATPHSPPAPIPLFYCKAILTKRKKKKSQLVGRGGVHPKER